jgi:hypothetical protein
MECLKILLSSKKEYTLLFGTPEERKTSEEKRK